MSLPAASAALPRLQTRIGLVLGGLTLFTALVLSAYLSNAAEKQVLRQSSSNLEGVSSQLARELAAGMNRFVQAVLTETYNDRFRDPSRSVASMRDALDQFKLTNPEFAYVSIVDVATARVVAANGGIFEGGDATGRPTFEKGKLGPFVGDVHDAVRLAELLPKPPNGEALRFLDVSAPITDASGKTVRVFATHVAWQWTDDLRMDIFGPLKDKLGVEAFLVDTAGRVVLAGAPGIKVGTDLATIAQTDTAEARVVAWPGGGNYLTVIAATTPKGQFPGFGWKVVARQPVELAAAAGTDLRRAFFIGALALGLLGAGAAWWVAGRLVRPVRLLAEAATRASAGSPDMDLPSAHGTAEVSAVQGALRHLAQTARSQAEASSASQRQFSVLAKSLPQVVFQADATGRIEYINRDLLRASGDQAMQRVADLEKLVLGADCEEFRHAWQRSLENLQDLKVRCRVHQKEEAPRWFDIEAHAIKSDSGALVCWVGTLFDVHDMTVRAEDAQQALEKERAARLEAERVSKLRDEFLATVSHELRSPLSCITGWSDVLRMKSKDNPMLAKAADVIRRNAEIQAGLINDLLDVTAVMAGKLVLNTEPLDLTRIAKEVVLSQLHAAQSKGVALKCLEAMPLIVAADRRRISQVLANLVGNAIKFTDAGGNIEVAASQRGADAVVQVTDTGRGIAANFLPHVFERMRQEDSSTTRRAGGLGLGLAIVQGLVALHRGAVSAASGGVGQGAVFTVTLPLAPEMNLASPPYAEDDADAPAVELVGRRILLVDDETDARDVAHVALSSLGAEVRIATSGAEVLQILEHETFDVLVSDVGMPDMDGLSLLRAIRRSNREAVANLPAVALTAFAMESDRLLGLQAGFQAYVTKPISLRRLAEAVEEAMGVFEASSRR